MTFLIDENLSRRLVGLLEPVFPNCLHAADVGLLRADDTVVRAAALELERAILSKDDDFQQLSESLGFPPKVLWVNLGNCSTRTVLEAILARQNDIRSFLAESETGVLILDP